MTSAVTSARSGAGAARLDQPAAHSRSKSGATGVPWALARSEDNPARASPAAPARTAARRLRIGERWRTLFMLLSLSPLISLRHQFRRPFAKHQMLLLTARRRSYGIAVLTRMR